MFRSAFAAVLVGVALVAVGCETDVFVPPPDGEIPSAPLPVGPLGEAYPWWTPDIIVIGEDGEPLADFAAEISNHPHYDTRFSFGEDVSEFSGQQTPRWRNGEVDRELVPILTPLLITIEPPGPQALASIYVDVVPTPGETLVLDLREAREVVTLDLSGVRDEWPIEDLILEIGVPSAVVDVDGDSVTVGVRANIDLELDAGQERVSFRSRIPDGAVIDRWILEGLDFRGRNTYFRVATEDGRVIRAMGPAVEIVPSPRRGWCRVQRRGAPVAATMASIVVSDRDTPSWTDVERVVGASAFPFDWFGDEGDLRVTLRGGLHLTREILVSAADTDTVVIELGEHDLVVEVVDRAGRPASARRVRVDSRLDDASAAEQNTPANGRVDFAAAEDLYRIEVDFGSQFTGEFAAIDTSVYVESDTFVRIVDPREPTPEALR